MKNEKQKTKNDKRKMKNERRKTKNEKRDIGQNVLKYKSFAWQVEFWHT